MKTFMFAMIVVAILIGCAHKEPVILEPADDVTAKAPTHDPRTGLRLEKWPEEEKKFLDEMEEMRAQRAEAQQVQTQQQQGVEQAQIIESLARADKLTRE